MFSLLCCPLGYRRLGFRLPSDAICVLGTTTCRWPSDYNLKRFESLLMVCLINFELITAIEWWFVNWIADRPVCLLRILLESSDHGDVLLSTVSAVSINVFNSCFNLFRFGYLEESVHIGISDCLLINRKNLLMYRGQIAVKYEDVLVAKEKFNKRLPPSRSLFSSQTSSILPNSCSYFRTTTTPMEAET
ncbi:hypothetical protein L1987_18297 [Smallanthus sonchifolius]|uniref:Uncharacterized protein n=1 Tax=Smallanthus sonchifolius TaxID=185202 RepID=A0ACB9IZX6_9ASTR|nr:hypothetical protein L1987_18297 [Smallanthus sonchifolius]